jgi:beta-lactamase superfamily II metal-dependent hydrolase
MRAIVLVATVVWASGLSGAPQATVRPDADPCLNLRASPQSSAIVVACLAPGTSVEVLEQAPYWRKVRSASHEGWAAKRYLEDSAAAAPADETEDHWLEVHFIDVGQGDGIWIHTPDDGVANGRFEGKNILIDGGPRSGDSNNAFLAYLREFAHPNAVIDALLVTHPHNDHYPGASGILRNFVVRTVFDPGFPKDGSMYAAFLNLVRSEPDVDFRLGRDDFGTIDWGSEIKAEIIYSYPGSPEGLGTGNTVENNASLVLRLEYGNQVFLFMGDAEGKERHGAANDPQFVERILLDTMPERLKATVLKIAHHGSETSSTEQFINAVDPEVVVVSSGRKSFSGTFLPVMSTLKRYCCHNPSTLIYRTDQDDELEGRTTANDADGDHVIIRTNGKVLDVRAFSNGQPITMDRCLPECENE